jgi:peptide/nickel transport system substrate-binding protein
MIAAVTPDGGFTLTSNPYFRQWSFAAQPKGYPDRIQYQNASTSNQAISDVLGGSADVVAIGSGDRARLGDHAQLIKDFAGDDTERVYLNAKVAPFDDVNVRRALNYAVDRRTFVDLLGGVAAADTSCQLLPTGFPAYRRYCPYQAGPATGPYLGPDVPHAKELVRESGKDAVPITVHSFYKGTNKRAFSDYIGTVLRQIGFKDVKVVDIPPTVSDADPLWASYQIFTWFGWIPDYQGAQTFYDQFSCTRPNVSRYCKPEIQAKADEAAAAADRDPTHSLQLWGEVDQMLTDDAAFVTLGNPRSSQLVSPRLHNIELSPQLGVVVSQVWVN